MPRYRRLIVPGSVQHVISRFVDREFRFDVPGARQNYLTRVGAALARTDWRVLGFALMSSHVHWILVAGTRPSSALIKPLHAGFAAWLNKVEDRVGPVFADRHRSITCEAPTAATLLAYIHNNPVRAGLVGDPSDSAWTSHRAYLGETPAYPWLDVRLGLSLCGFAADATGRDAFHALTVARSSECRSLQLSGGDLDVRRRRARAELNGPVELVNPELSQRDGGFDVKTRVFVPPSCLVRGAWPGSARTLLLFAERALGVSIFELCCRSRGLAIARARRLVVLTWALYLHRPCVEIARELGVASSSVAELIASADRAAHEQAANMATMLQSEAPNG